MPIRRLGSLLPLLLVLALGLPACGGKSTVLPPTNPAEADKFLFDKGTELLKKKNWITAREYFKRLIDSFPGSQYRQAAKLGVGDSYLGEGRVDSVILAVNEYREFLQYFPLDDRADYASYKICEGTSKQMLSPQRDQTATIEAIRECDNFLRAYPTSAYRPQVEKLHRAARDRLSQSEFEVGMTYYRARWYQGAGGRWQPLLTADPGYTKRDALYYYMGELLVRLERPQEALPYYDKVVAEFPKSEYVKKAREQMAKIKKAPAIVKR
jgi:outer membrane protein assembly factor BamD